MTSTRNRQRSSRHAAGRWAGTALMALTLAGIAPLAAIATEVHSALKNGQFDRARELIEDGFDVNALGPQGDTALHWVAFHGQVELTRLLLSRGADVESQVRNGNTPLHLAAYSGQDDTAALLLDAGARVDARNLEDITPLHWAARNGHVRIIEMLLGRGARIDAPDLGGLTPLDYAGREQQDAAFELLRDRMGKGLAADSTGESLVSVQRPAMQASGGLSRRASDASESPTTTALTTAPVPGTETKAAVNAVAGSSENLPNSPPREAAASAPPSRSGTTANAPGWTEQPADGPPRWVQLLASTSEKDAKYQARRVTRRHAAVLGSAPLETREGTAGGKPVFRVRVGPLPAAQASGLCRELKAAGQDCFLVGK